MGRLIAFGCSYTYGWALPDDLRPGEPYGRLPVSRLAWPQIAADMLGIECHNLALNGNSNINILRSVLQHQWQVGDMAGILWSGTRRDSLYQHDLTDGKDWLSIGPWLSEEDHVRKYYDIHTDADMELRSWIYQYTASLHLRSLGIPYAMSSMNWWDSRYQPCPDNRNVDPTLITEAFLDTADDGEHPGPATHRQWGRIFASMLMQDG